MVRGGTLTIAEPGGATGGGEVGGGGAMPIMEEAPAWLEEEPEQ
jgi:hypothetical protein